jgi:hypothetical protein
MAYRLPAAGVSQMTKIVASIHREQINPVDPVMLFVMHILHSATNAHILHWITRNNAQHMVLGDYYDDVVPMIDKFVESFQGKYGRLHDFIADYKLPATDPMDYMKSLQTEVESLRRMPNFPQDSELQNEVDNIANLINVSIDRLTRD